MSGISGFCTVFATVQALIGKTWAGDNVLMAPGSTLPEIKAPTICVYGNVGRLNAEEPILLQSERMVLRFELLAPATQYTAPDGSFTFDSAEAPYGLLAIIWRQCLQVLLVDQSPWANMRRELVETTHNMEFRAELWEFEKGGERVPASVVDWELQIAPEPGFDTPPQGVWALFLETLRAADAGGVDQGLSAVLRSVLQAPLSTAGWQLEMAQLGVSAGTLRDIGEGTLDEDTTHEIVGARTAVIKDVDSEPPDDVLAINTNDPPTP